MISGIQKCAFCVPTIFFSSCLVEKIFTFDHRGYNLSIDKDSNDTSKN